MPVKTERLEIRISTEQKALWKQLASSAGLSIPAWLERIISDRETHLDLLSEIFYDLANTGGLYRETAERLVKSLVSAGTFQSENSENALQMLKDRLLLRRQDA